LGDEVPESGVTDGLVKLLQVSDDLKENPWKLEMVADAMPDIVHELDRLSKVPLFTFVPFGKWPPDPTHQIGFLADDTRIKGGVCGNRSGKTLVANVEDCFDCIGLDSLLKGPTHRWPGRDKIDMWAVSDTEETSINIIQRGIAELLGEEIGFGWELVDDSTQYDYSGGFKNNEIIWATGSHMGFKFSTQKRRSFQGVALDKVRLDEEPPKDIYSECYTRTADREGRISITFTPVYDRSRGLSWIYEDLYLKADELGASFHNWSIFDNPHLSDGSKAELMRAWDEDERDVRAFGMFTPMGVRPALDRALIREAELSVETPRSCYLQVAEHGEVELIEL
jgi:phage terminase large subunit-like protein